jgi:hypothetical protein
MRRTLGLCSVSLSLLLSGALAAYTPAEATVHHRDLSWQITNVGSDQELRGLAPVDRRTAWVSGDSGGVWRTTDAGATWQDVSPPGSTEDTLYRDVEATDADHALVLAIGEGRTARSCARLTAVPPGPRRSSTTTRTRSTTAWRCGPGVATGSR